LPQDVVRPAINLFHNKLAISVDWLVHVRLPPTPPTPPSQQQQLQSPYPYISNPLSPTPSTHSFLPQQQQYGGFADQDAYNISNGQQQQQLQEEGDMFEYADLTNPTTVAISEGTDCLESINSYFDFVSRV
jgi:hypothetical protein